MRATAAKVSHASQPRPSTSFSLSAVAVLVTVLLAAASCAGSTSGDAANAGDASSGDTTSGDAQTACGDHQELLDTRSFHVLDVDETTYDIHPPTSGPHASIVPESGIHAEPVSEPEQVAALEQGWVVVNHANSLNPDQVEILEEIARTEGVLVTPAPEPIDDSREIAFTAWGVRQLCESVTLADARAFVEQFADRVDGHA